MYERHRHGGGATLKRYRRRRKDPYTRHDGDAAARANAHRFYLAHLREHAKHLESRAREARQRGENVRASHLFAEAKVFVKRADRSSVCGTSAFATFHGCEPGLKASPVVHPVDCGLPGCPVCASREARRKSSELANDAIAVWAHFGRKTPARPGYSLKMLTLTLKRSDWPGVDQMRADAKTIWAAWRKLWGVLRRIQGPVKWSKDGKRRLRHRDGTLQRDPNPRIGAWPHLEFGGGGHAHLHVLMLLPWAHDRGAVDGESPRWLMEHWRRITEDLGQPSTQVDIRGLYYYEDAYARSQDRKTMVGQSTDDTIDFYQLRRGAAEVAKYLAGGPASSRKVAPDSRAPGMSLPLWIAAAIVARDVATSRRYGVFRGDAIKEARAAVLLAPKCPHCKREDCHAIITPIYDRSEILEIIAARPPPGGTWHDSFSDIR